MYTVSETKQLNIGDRTKWNLSVLHFDFTPFTHGYTDPVPYGNRCIYTVEVSLCLTN
jgi:hypothetical protein